jgi:hypothetical protein
MRPPLDTDKVIRLTLEALLGDGGGSGVDPIIKSVEKRYGRDESRPVNDTEVRNAALHCLNNFLRGGIIGLGSERQGTWHPSLCFLTEHGKTSAEQASRDPINRAGYLAYLEQDAPLDPTTKGYVEEALDTYRSCCYRATAFLIGAAVENLVLDLRDELLERLKKTGLTPPNGLDDWSVKKVIEAIAARVLPDLRSASKTDDGIRKLKEDAESRLAPIAAEFRRLRNEAGHPAALAPIQPADAHANLLLFPPTVKLLRQLKEWVANFYV